MKTYTIRYNSIKNQIRTDCVVRNFINGEECSFEVEAVWDPGAKITTLSPRLITLLGAKEGRIFSVKTVGGRVIQSSYNVELELPSYAKISNLEVLCGELDGFDVLIGMDVISQGDIAISNFKGKTTFSFRFPSAGEIDFCESSPEQGESHKENATDTPWWKRPWRRARE